MSSVEVFSLLYSQSYYDEIHLINFLVSKCTVTEEKNT